MELSADYATISALGAEVLAVSTDQLSAVTHAVERLGLQFPVLYDPSADVVREYGVYNLFNDSVAAPATFLLDKSGAVRWKYIGKGKYDRPENEEIIAKLGELDQ